MNQNKKIQTSQFTILNNEGNSSVYVTALFKAATMFDGD
jgi:hypothetical protein